MTDDPTRPSATEDGEQRLRKVLGTVDDLEPPRDDLFMQRALLRGRARTSRRRSAMLGAAAAVVVGAVIGGSCALVAHPLVRAPAVAWSCSVRPGATSQPA